VTALVTNIVLPDDFFWIGMVFLYSPLYSMSIFVSLNERKQLRQLQHDYETQFGVGVKVADFQRVQLDARTPIQTHLIRSNDEGNAAVGLQHG
jgi:hypothetical protein